MNRLNRDELVTQPEVETLIKSLLQDAEYHSYAVYGLMFLFGSIRKMITAGQAKLFDDVYFAAMTTLYANSANIETAIVKAAENIHVPYRAADFTNCNQTQINAAFVISEFGEPVEANKDETAAPPLAVLDLSDSSIVDLAQKLSDLMNNPNAPEPIRRGIDKVMTDFFNSQLGSDEFNDDMRSPEYIARHLKVFKEAQNDR